MAKKSVITLGHAVTQLREEKGWSQRELSRRCNVSATQIQRIENDEIESPGLVLMLAMAEALDVHPMRLIMAFQGQAIETDVSDAALQADLKEAFHQFLLWQKAQR